MLITEFGTTTDISKKDYGITSGARSILGYGSSQLVKTKKKKKKTFQSLKKIFALGKKKRKQKQTIENKGQKKNLSVSNMKTNTPFNIIFLKIICSTFKSQTNSIVLKINCL